MKILQIAPIIERVPPTKYGGTERVVHALTEELVKRGHDVTLFASGDSITSAKLVSVYPRALREAKVADLYGSNAWSLLNVGLAYKKQDEFDIIHDHNSHISIATASLSRTPVVMTLHNAFSPSSKKLFETLNDVNFVSVSNSQRIPVPGLNYVGTVYNGLEMQHYPFSPVHKGYLLFVGSMTFEKGVHNAIDIAQHLNVPLIIASKLDDNNVRYFKEFVEPRLSEHIRWIGEVDETERNKLMSEALCLLHPVTWREPFGLTLIEAMACGAPVIAFNRGSIPEIIVNEKTGFIVEDTEEMIEAIKHIEEIDRAVCRKHSLENFNVQKMVDGYEKIYSDIKARKMVSNGKKDVFRERKNSHIYA